MEENLSKFITAILAIIIMFIFPVYIAYEKKDDISYALAVRYTQDFVDKVRSKGYITRELYEDYTANLLTTGNTYSVELEHRYVRFDPSDNIGDESIKAVRSEEVYSTEHILNFMDNNEEHKYVMNVNDNFNVKIKNTNVTMATIIYNIVTVNMSKNNVRVYVDYGGKILADKWWGNISFFPGGEDIDYKKLVLGSDLYTITNDLTNVTNSNTLESIKYGNEYEADLTVGIDYVLDSVSVLMGGEDVTNTVYDENTQKIVIDSVEGDIVITAKARLNQDEYSITNNLIYVTSSSTDTEVHHGNRYESNLRATEDYVVDSVSVLMGGEDVTDTVYDENTQKIVIDYVKGDVVITAKGALDKSMIPSGFYYVGGTKSTGLVISDSFLDANSGIDATTCYGNQFVWIPVENMDNFKRTTANVTNYMEPYYEDGYDEEVKEYNAMIASVKKYKGFYIARYKAASQVEKVTYIVFWASSMTEIKEKEGAVYLARSMYENNKYVVSTLCYGVQWDTAFKSGFSSINYDDKYEWTMEASGNLHRALRCKTKEGTIGISDLNFEYKLFRF